VGRSLDGGYRFVGRADDMIKVGGAWVDAREVENNLADLNGVGQVAICGREAFVVLKGINANGQENNVSHGGLCRPGILKNIKRALPQDFALFVVPALPRVAATGKVDRAQLTRLVGIGEPRPKLRNFEKEQSLAEHRRCQRCWRPTFLTLTAGAGLWRLFWWSGWPILWSAGKSLVYDRTLRIALELPSWPRPANVNDCFILFSRITCQILVDVSFRLTSCAYIILSCRQLELGPWLANVPGGICGTAVMLGAALPAPGICSLAAIPGVWLAARRQRLMSWPLVFLLGFPFWAEEEWRWWALQEGPFITMAHEQDG
jgi:Acyl-CoA synthetases (AMP-forming)/AMP-acid ligases II